MGSIGQTSALLLEDQPLISLYVQELLRQLEIETITTVVSTKSALKWLKAHTPTLVVMETKLQGKTCETVVDILAKRNVPIIFHTVQTRDTFSPRHDGLHCKWVVKPCDPEDFVNAVKNILRVRNGGIDDPIQQAPFGKLVIPSTQPAEAVK